MLNRDTNAGLATDHDMLQTLAGDLTGLVAQDDPGWHYLDCTPDPNGRWVLAGDGIYETMTTRNGTRLEKVTGQPIYIKDRAIDIDTGLESLTVVWEDGLRLREYTAPRRSMSGSGGVMDLADHGYAVHQGNVRRIVAYLAHLLDYHKDNIPIRYVASSCGTKLIEGMTVFMIGNRCACGMDDGPDVSFDPHSDADGVVSNLRSRPDGNLAAWVEMASQMGEHPCAAFGVAASFLAPILKDLGLAQNPIIDYGGTSSTGKTTTLKFCASAWGYPMESDGGLVRSWSGTETYFERYAAMMNELPIFLDESHKANPREACNTLYQYANGKGRGRGSLSGIRKDTRYRGVLFSAGESQLTAISKNDGIKARVISFWGSPFQSGMREFVDRINRVSVTHYGLAGKAVVQDYLRNRSTWQSRLTQMHTDMADRLASIAEGDIEQRVANCFGAVYAAGMLANAVLDIGWDVDAIVNQAFLRVSENRAPSSAQESIELVGSWIASNWASFSNSVDGSAESEQSYGRVFADREDGKERIAIAKHILENFLNQHQYPFNPTILQWIDHGWVDTDPGRRSKKVRLGDQMAYMVVLNQAGIAASGVGQHDADEQISGADGSGESRC